MDTSRALSYSADSEDDLAPSYNTHSENVSGVLASYSSAPSSIDYTAGKSEAPMLTYSSSPPAAAGDGQGVVNTAEPRLFNTSSAPSSIDYTPENVSEAPTLTYSSSPSSVAGDGQGVGNTAEPLLFTSSAPVSIDYTPENVSEALMLTYSSSPASGQSTVSTSSTHSSAPAVFSCAAVGSRILADQVASFRAEIPFYVDSGTTEVRSVSLSQRITKTIRSIFRFHPVVEVPNADEVIKLCIATVESSKTFWSTTGERRADDFLNWHQCGFLLRRLRATGFTLTAIQQSPLLGENTIPALQELHKPLGDAERLMRKSFISTECKTWLRAATEQGELKETFSHLLYEIQWCTSVLQSILVENSKESHVEFDPTLCNCRLSAGDELELLTAMKEDEVKLRNRLKATVEQLGVLKPAGKFASKLLEKLEAYSPHLVFLNPDDLVLKGPEIGKGSFGIVKISKFLDCECVVKVLSDFNEISIKKEKESIEKLGNHPHLVRHFCCSSKENRKFYLVMERLEMDLGKALRRVKKMRGKSLALVEAVSLMLQIGEGMKYMHGKGVAHRDLKPGNVLVNFDGSRIHSVKIADFGSAKAADKTKTSTMNAGTTKYMAPEVMKQAGDPDKVRLNPLKADVYSFAIMSIEILTGDYPYECNINNEIRKLSKAGERPILRKLDYPLRLTTLLTKCWAGISHERPLFPEICRELRYIKGLLLKGDEQKLQTQIPGPQRPMEGLKLQGPWGDPKNGNEFYDIATSIRGITLSYSTHPGIVRSLKVTYGILGKTFVRESYVRYKGSGQYTEKIEFQPDIEYIKQISGFVSELEVNTDSKKRITIKIVSSLKVHTNLQVYGPFGEERGTEFTSEKGSRVIGFYGRAGNILDSLGVVTIPDI